MEPPPGAPDAFPDQDPQMLLESSEHHLHRRRHHHHHRHRQSQIRPSVW